MNLPPRPPQSRSIGEHESLYGPLLHCFVVRKCSRILDHISVKATRRFPTGGRASQVEKWLGSACRAPVVSRVFDVANRPSDWTTEARAARPVCGVEDCFHSASGEYRAEAGAYPSTPQFDAADHLFAN